MRMALGDGLRQGTFFLGLLSVWLSASGHHSFAVDFDSDKLVTIAGVVSRMVPVTPHPRLYVDVTNGSGTRTTWELQGRRGDTEIVVGANVAVEGYLHRRRSEALYVTSIKVGAGPELSAGLELGEFRVGITPVSDYRTFAQIASEFSNDYPVDITGNWNNRYKGSLTVDDLEPKPTPFTADGRRRYAENQEFGKDPALRCINIGLPRLFGGPSRVKIYDVGPYYLFLYSLAQNAFRTIYMDGRDAPENQPLTFVGFSKGRWEGQSLIIETVRLKPMWLDTSGLPMSGAETRIVETYTPSADRLTMDRMMVIQDPLYTKSLVRNRFSARDEDTPLGDNPCDPDSFYYDLVKERAIEGYFSRKGI